MNKNSDKAFEKMAQIYAEHLGQTLKTENSQITLPLDTISLDQKVHTGIDRNKKRTKIVDAQKYMKIFVPIAACFALVVLVARWDRHDSFSEQLAMESSEEAPSSEVAELIPLSYPLPSNFTVVDQKLDNGMTVYQLSDTYNDDVVMQLAYVESIDYEVDGLQEILVNGEPVYAEVENDYQKITFEKNGIVYILTCKYDINTLLPICENIL